MKKIIAINASPRTTWNTASLVREAAKGAEAEGAEVRYFDLYKLESYNQHLIPVLFIMTSNCAEEFYDRIGYDKMLEIYKNSLSSMVGPTKVMVCGNTLQVHDYEKYNWTMFDPEVKKARREAVFPKELARAFSLGAEMVRAPWEA